jgi:predicted transposase YdaD
MGYAKYVDDHVFLREIRATALAEGEAKGKAEGKAKGKAEALTAMLTTQLRVKFGPLPKWARLKVKKAEPSQLERWATKVLTAETLDEVIGKR